MVMHHNETCWAAMPALLDEVQAIADDVGLPFLAAQADLADPEPMSDQNGLPYAESRFRWINSTARFWRNRKLALNSPLLSATRLVSEAFYCSGGQLSLGRPSRLLDGINGAEAQKSIGHGEAIITPVHMPRGLVGTVFWVSKEPVGIATIFTQHAARLQNIAIRLASTHNEARGRLRSAITPQRLTRREAQCLRWAAAGKTDGEIGIILDLSVSTVRFHLRNAGKKLGATGRAQSIQLAAGLGFIGSV